MNSYYSTLTPSGDRMWYLDGKLHREGGPAVISIDEDGVVTMEWWVNGEQIIK